jgi:hypothetical protein
MPSRQNIDNENAAGSFKTGRRRVAAIRHIKIRAVMRDELLDFMDRISSANERFVVVVSLGG